MKYRPRHLKYIPYRGKRKKEVIKGIVASAILFGIAGSVIRLGYVNSEVTPTASPEPTPYYNETLKHTTVTIVPEVTPKVSLYTPYSLDFSLPSGTLYSLTHLLQWSSYTTKYLRLNTPQAEDIVTIKEFQQMQAVLLDLFGYRDVTGESLSQILAKIVTQEIGGLKEHVSYSTVNMERAAVVWSILNRIDQCYDDSIDGKSLAALIVEKAKTPVQYAYSHDTLPLPGTEEISTDVLIRWILEKYGHNCGRVLPPEFIYFGGDGVHNYFRDEFLFKEAFIWDWSYPDPYKE